MANVVLLNNKQHQNLRLKTRRSADLGDNMWFAVTFPLEFRHCQSSYPLFFYKDPQNNQFFPVALFGFQHNENLFLHNGWQDQYLPLSVQRQPFKIGRVQAESNGQLVEHMVVHVDLDSPRISETEGEPLFLPLGGESDLLLSIGGALEALHEGMADAERFCKTIEELQLMEPVSVSIKLNNGKQHQMVGFWTIAEEPLAKLDAATLGRLHEQGYLQAIYLMIASQGQIRKLIELKNQQVEM